MSIPYKHTLYGIFYELLSTPFLRYAVTRHTVFKIACQMFVLSIYAMHHPLPSYLKAYRVRSSLTQTEVAWLLGIDAQPIISRYEHGRSLPHIAAGIKLELIFDTSDGNLFPQVTERASQELLPRTEMLLTEMKNSEQLVDPQKIASLANIHTRLKDFRAPLV